MAKSRGQKIIRLLAVLLLAGGAGLWADEVTPTAQASGGVKVISGLPRARPANEVDDIHFGLRGTVGYSSGFLGGNFTQRDCLTGDGELLFGFAREIEFGLGGDLADHLLDHYTSLPVFFSVYGLLPVGDNFRLLAGAGVGTDRWGWNQGGYFAINGVTAFRGVGGLEYCLDSTFNLFLGVVFVSDNVVNPEYGTLVDERIGENLGMTVRF